MSSCSAASVAGKPGAELRVLQRYERGSEPRPWPVLRASHAIVSGHSNKRMNAAPRSCRYCEHILHGGVDGAAGSSCNRKRCSYGRHESSRRRPCSHGGSNRLGAGCCRSKHLVTSRSHGRSSHACITMRIARNQIHHVANICGKSGVS